MSDEILSTNSEPLGATEIDSTPIEETNLEVDEVTTEEITEPVENPEEPKETQEEIPAVPEKIKLGEKEYTPAELESLVKEQETKKAEEESSKYQPRELEIIEKDFERENSNLEADVASLKKRFLAKAETPYQLVQDPETGETIKQPLVDYTPDWALACGEQTGDWSYFYKCLGAESAAFDAERAKLFNEYIPKIDQLNAEKNYIEAIKTEQENISQYDSYKEAELKDKPAESQIVDFVKTRNIKFDKEGMTEFLQTCRNAFASEYNTAQLSAENDLAKKAMGSTLAGGATPVVGNKVFSRKEIDSMSDDAYLQNEKAIFDQAAKGLIK
jgi:hypothetical protein